VATADRTVHLVGHAHLDPVWLWPWQEGYQESRATFRSALDRMIEPTVRLGAWGCRPVIAGLPPR